MGQGVAVDIKVPYLVEDRDRHGNVRRYVRQNGKKKIRIREKPDTPEFWTAYRSALGEVGPIRGVAGTLRWLCERYYQSAEFKQLSDSTKKVRRAILDRVCASDGDKRYSMLEPRHVRQRRDELADKPEAANSVLKALRQVFTFAKNNEIVSRNPIAEVPYLEGSPEGFHTWTDAEVEQYRNTHPIGTKARLALDILLYTGARRSDAVTFGRQMERDGWLCWVEVKGRKRVRKERAIPILSALRVSLDACPSGHMTWLVTSFGKPFTSNGFGNWFKRQCVAAGLPHCSAHGVRKAGANACADNGATEQQMMAIFGWENAKTASVYTKKANRRKLAGDAMHTIEVSHFSENGVPLPCKGIK